MIDLERIDFFLGIEIESWEKFNDDTVAELTNGRGDLYVRPVEEKDGVLFDE